MNHAREIANMLGLEIGEKFTIKGHPDYGTFWFVDDQSEGWRELWKVDLEKGFYDAEIEINDTLEQLLAGFYEVEKMPWKPKRSQKYYTVNYTLQTNEKVIDETIWIDSVYDLMRWKSGNCFKTRKKAEIKGEELIERLRKEYEEA